MKKRAVLSIIAAAVFLLSVAVCAISLIMHFTSVLSYLLFNIDFSLAGMKHLIYPTFTFLLQSAGLIFAFAFAFLLFRKKISKLTLIPLAGIAAFEGILFVTTSLRTLEMRYSGGSIDTRSSLLVRFLFDVMKIPYDLVPFVNIALAFFRLAVLGLILLAVAILMLTGKNKKLKVLNNILWIIATVTALFYGAGAILPLLVFGLEDMMSLIQLFYYVSYNIFEMLIPGQRPLSQVLYYQYIYLWDPLSSFLYRLSTVLGGAAWALVATAVARRFKREHTAPAPKEPESNT